MNNRGVLSPLTGSDRVRLVKTFPSKELIKQYHKIYDIDVAAYFKNIDQVFIFECIESGYRFFYPPTIDGDALFYQQLQKIDWYYQDSKWEYDIVLGLLKSGDQVLEVGCGKGSFLRKIKDKAVAIGLELNDDVIKLNDDVLILNKTIQEFVKTDRRKFDWVISFQVLEHISDVKSFLQDSITSLKPGGKLVIAVPNNSAYFFSYRDIEFDNFEYQKTLLLNSPPHHMGLWNERNIRFLSIHFGIELIDQFIEPISPWRIQLNKSILRRKFGFFYRLLVKILPEHLVYSVVSKTDKTLTYGDTIISVFRKS